MNFKEESIIQRIFRAAPGALLAGLLLLCSWSMAAAAEGNETEKPAVDLTPHIHGALRARFEYSTRTGEERFQMRNARLTIDGALAPAIDYYVQMDACDRGKMKILDAWGRLQLATGLRLQAGQFRLPMGTDCFRGPSGYIFSNRSFLVKEMNNVRGVGAKLAYASPASGKVRWGVDAGAFNPTSISDQERWNKTLAYAAKARVATGNVAFEAGAETLRPDLVRVNLLGASMAWSHGGWLVEGEYLYKHYAHDAHRTAHGWQVFGNYGFPVKWGMFNRASVQARYDGITAHSSGRLHDDGLLHTDFDPCNRATLGTTLTYSYGRVHCDIRLSFEKYFYHTNHTLLTPDAEDKLCAELVVRF